MDPTLAANPTPVRPKPSSARLWLILAILFTVSGGGIWAYVAFRHNLFPRNWGKVEEGFYRSAELAPNLTKSTLQKHGVQVMVILTADNPPDEPKKVASREAAAALGIERQIYPLGGDGTGPVESYIGALQKIAESRRAGKTVLVQCAAGTNRTGGVVASYQMLFEGVTPDAALATMKQYKFNPADNQKLLPYLNRNLPAIAHALVERGVLPTLPAVIPQFPGVAAAAVPSTEPACPACTMP